MPHVVNYYLQKAYQEGEGKLGPWWAKDEDRRYFATYHPILALGLSPHYPFLPKTFPRVGRQAGRQAVISSAPDTLTKASPFSLVSRPHVWKQKGKQYFTCNSRSRSIAGKINTVLNRKVLWKTITPFHKTDGDSYSCFLPTQQHKEEDATLLISA